MKRSALQCVVGFIGAILIVVGVVWTCKQLTSPSQLNAAQSRTSNRSSSLPSTEGSTPVGSLSLSVENVEPSVSDVVLEEQQNREDVQVQNNIRPTSGGSLSLSVIDSDQDESNNSYFEGVGENSETIESLENFAEPFDGTQQESYPDSFSTASPLESFSEQDEIVNAESAEETLFYNDHTANAPDFGDEQQESFEDFPQQLVEQPTLSVAPPQSSFAQPQTEDFPNVDPLESVNTDVPQFDVQNTSRPIVGHTEQPSVQDTRQIPENQQVRSVPIPTINQSPDSRVLEVNEPAPSSFNNVPVSNALSGPRVENKIISQFVNEKAISLPEPKDEVVAPQTLQISIDKKIPDEVLLNTSVEIVIVVKNNGTTEVKNLVLRDSVPKGAQFAQNSSNVTPDESGELIWDAFNLSPQEEKTFKYSIIPQKEGLIGSVATVMAVASASGSFHCSKPKLKVDVSAPENIVKGQVVPFVIVVSNIGTGTANNVVIKENIPEGLYHPDGTVLTNTGLNSIKAGESKRITLELQATGAGTIANELVVSADNCEEQRALTEVQVLAPELKLAVEGPESIYLERNATYKLSVQNIGRASAFDVQLTARLPEGTQFVETDNLGAYKKEENTVYWDLAELPAQTGADIKLKIATTGVSRSELVFSAVGPNNLTATANQQVTIDGLAALSFNVHSSTDLVEVGKEFEYSIQIENRGTKASNNVVLQILPPDAIVILATDGPTKAENRDGVVVFQKIDSIPAKNSVTYKIKAKPMASGDCRVSFQLSSDDLEPLVKEENTRVYR